MSLMKIIIFKGAKDTGVPTALEIKKKMLKLIYDYNNLRYDFT
jgi:hypothetical protein